MKFLNRKDKFQRRIVANFSILTAFVKMTLGSDRGVDGAV